MSNGEIKSESSEISAESFWQEHEAAIIQKIEEIFGRCSRFKKGLLLEREKALCEIIISQISRILPFAGNKAPVILLDLDGTVLGTELLGENSRVYLRPSIIILLKYLQGEIKGITFGILSGRSPADIENVLTNARIYPATQGLRSFIDPNKKFSTPQYRIQTTDSSELISQTFPDTNIFPGDTLKRLQTVLDLNQLSPAEYHIFVDDFVPEAISQSNVGISVRSAIAFNPDNMTEPMRTIEEAWQLDEISILIIIWQILLFRQTVAKRLRKPQMEVVEAFSNQST